MKIFRSLKSTGHPQRMVACFCVWSVSLLLWEIFIRICIGGVRPGNLTLLVFIPGEAAALTALTSFFQKHRVICAIENTLVALGVAVFYFAHLVYHRIFGSLIPVGLMGMGGQAMDDFGWTIRGALVRSLLDLPLILLPVLAMAFLSFRGSRSGANAQDVPTGTGDIDDPDAAEDILDLDKMEDEDIEDTEHTEDADRIGDTENIDNTAYPDIPDEKTPFVLKGYPLWLHGVSLAAAVLLWLLGSFSLALFGRGHDSAWYVYHSELSDTDTSAERIGVLATTLVEAYVYQSGQERDLAGTVTSEINFEALDLPDRNKKDQQKPASEGSSAVAADTETSDNSGEEQTPDTDEPEIVIRPRIDDRIDFAELGEKAEKDSIKILCDYFASRRATSTNACTGLFEGYNLIYICGEGFSGYGIDPEITPLLYKMSQGGIVLKNFYNSFPNTTTNGEYAFDTSLWPDVSRSARNGSVVGSFPQSASVFMPYGLGDLFTAAGANCYAYHNYRGDYYMRDLSWPNLGYDNANIKFLGRGMTFSSAWPASDLEMMEQSVDDYINDDWFHAYYMTFSGHGPYDTSNAIFRKNIDKVRELAGGRYQNEEVLGYFCGEYELEKSIEYLAERLEEAGKLDKTVFVLIGDHFPYYLSDEAVREYNGGSLPDAIERSRSTCIIYNAGMEEPIESDVYCCNVDILPTVLNLFNIDFDSRLLMGTDVFSDGIHRARLYNGSFVTGLLKYDRTGGDMEWSADVRGMEQEELDAYAEAMMDYTESEYAVSLGMMENNFYFYVWKNAGLLSEEEAQAELTRQQKIRSATQVRAEEERVKAEELEREKAEEAERAAAEEAAGGGENPEGGGTPPADTAPQGDPAQQQEAAPQGDPAPQQETAPQGDPEPQPAAE